MCGEHQTSGFPEIYTKSAVCWTTRTNLCASSHHINTFGSSERGSCGAVCKSMCGCCCGDVVRSLLLRGVWVPTSPPLKSGRAEERTCIDVAFENLLSRQREREREDARLSVRAYEPYMHSCMDAFVRVSLPPPPTSSSLLP